MNDEEIKKYRKARETIDSCVDDAVDSLLVGNYNEYLKLRIRRICWQLAEDVVDAYVGNLELDLEELS